MTQTIPETRSEVRHAPFRALWDKHQADVLAEVQAGGAKRTHLTEDEVREAWSRAVMGIAQLHPVLGLVTFALEAVGQPARVTVISTGGASIWAGGSFARIVPNDTCSPVFIRDGAVPQVLEAARPSPELSPIGYAVLAHAPYEYDDGSAYAQEHVGSPLATRVVRVSEDDGTAAGWYLGQHRVPGGSLRKLRDAGLISTHKGDLFATAKGVEAYRAARAALQARGTVVPDPYVY